MGILRSSAHPAVVPVSTVAVMLKVSRQRVYQLIEKGLLSAQSLDGTWLVNYRSVESRIAMLRAESEGVDEHR